MSILKYIVLISIFFIVYFIGNLIAKRYKDRVNELYDFKELCNSFKSKMKFTYEPLGDILKDMLIILPQNNKMKKIISNTNCNLEKNDFKSSWEQGIESQRNNLNLKEEDIKILKNFGNMLGKTDIQGQVNEIDLTMNFLEKQIYDAEIECRKNEKMYRSLGTILGLAIVIILI